MKEDYAELIVGYRALSLSEIDNINEGKQLATQVGRWLDAMSCIKDDRGVLAYDVRWLAIARTQLQQGFMAATRGIARPTTF